eukprot:TRINITY_DN18135_c0_g1_i2.p1 TRINITY_DN18135_c0_g1~~TRINITY_DN18135_c0_g1_i2.p1  ORF type:complete len:401 (-),score=106.31 TRINITY_DN18135_c0_g1_i2:47-1249(-)
MCIRDRNTSRLLTAYQMGLVLAGMFLTLTLVEYFGWLNELLPVEVAEAGPPLDVNAAGSLSGSFVVDKRGLTSYPDLVFFQFPGGEPHWFGGEQGQWVWTHGILYAGAAPAALHALSGGILDPLYYTVSLRPPPKDSVCLRPHGNRTECCTELMSSQVDVDKELPQDGYFAFVRAHDMDIWELKLNSGIGRGMVMIPRTFDELTGAITGLVVMIMIVALLMATGFALVCAKYATNMQRSYLRQYIAQGMFLHEESESELYDKISEEEMGSEDSSVLQGYEKHSDSESSDEEAGGDHHHSSKRKKALSKQKRLERRLMEAIGEGQGTLHYISNTVNGAAPRAPVSIGNSNMMMLGPSTYEQVIQRTQTTLAHVFVMCMSTMPQIIMYFLSLIHISEPTRPY